MDKQTQQHTPGPWTWNPEGDETVVEIPINGEAQQFSILGFSTVASAEDYANARLIAAAPELLDALRGMVELAERLDCARVQPSHAPATAAARAAIAKAGAA